MKRAQVTAHTSQINVQIAAENASEGRHNLNAAALDTQNFSQQLVPYSNAVENDGDLLLGRVTSGHSPIL